MSEISITSDGKEYMLRWNKTQDHLGLWIDDVFDSIVSVGISANNHREIRWVEPCDDGRDMQRSVGLWIGDEE